MTVGYNCGYNQRIEGYLGIIQAIPFQPIANSPTGSNSKNLWEQVASEITNAVVSVANFIYNGLVAIGNLIEHATDVVRGFAMKP